MSRRVLVIGGSIAGGVVLVVLLLLALTVLRNGEVLPGVTVEDIELGGLGPDDVQARVEPLAAERTSEPVVLVHDGQQYSVDPAAVDVNVDVPTLVDTALDAGRTGSFVDDRIAALTGTDVSLDLDVQVDTTALAARIAEIAEDVDTPATPGGVSVDPVALEVDTTPPTPGVATLQDEAVALVTEAFNTPGSETIDLPVETIEPDTDAADVTAVADAARAVVAEDMTLTSDDGELVLSPRELAPLLSATQVGTGSAATLELVVTPDAVGDALVPLAEPLLRPATDASYTVPRSPPVQFDEKFDTSWSPVPVDVGVVPGSNGTEVDPDLAATTLTDAVRRAERTVTLPLAEYPPDVTTEQAREQAPTHLLSTFTTYHACCAARVTNIQRLADLVDGTVVAPGDQFSINQISGVRECSKGFAPAGMILNGEIVDSCGGGVSQFGTTTVNAVFFAGLEPDAYKPHSFYISRYPLAREATLNYPSPDIDVRFTNDTGAPIVVRTSYSGTSITVSFYGSSDVEEVRADVGGRTNVKPFRTERRVNRSLAPGSEVTVQGGLEGFYVPLTRTVVREDGTTTTDDWGNAYVAKTQIVEYNPAAPRPEPEPEPEPESAPEPEPAPDEPDSEG